MSEQAPRSNNEPIPSSSSERGKISRRQILFGTAALGAATTAGIIVRNRFLGKEPKKDEQKEEESLVEGVSFEQAEAKQKTFSKELLNHPLIKEAVEAQNLVRSIQLSSDNLGLALVAKVGTKPGFTQVVFANIRNISKAVRDGGSITFGDEAWLYFVSLAEQQGGKGKDIGVSNRFLITRRPKQGGEKETLYIKAVRRSRYEEGYVEYVTYTPPAAHLVAEKSVVEAGEQYVSQTIDNAKNLLEERLKKVKRSRHPVVTLDEIASICKRIAIIEHVDPYVFMDTNDRGDKSGVQKLFSTISAEYALNPGQAFNHLLNKKGAGGMMQIIPETYRSVRKLLIKEKLFSETELPEDETLGRKDPLISAIISLYLCFDNARIKKSNLEGLGSQDIEAAIVAMYNGSPNLLEKILMRQGGVVLRPQAVKKRVSKELLLGAREGNKLGNSGVTENVNYLQKYFALKESSFFHKK